MNTLFVLSLFVACAVASNYGQQGYSSAGLIDYPYEVLYDSKRDGPVEPPGIRRAGLIDITYEVVYDSKRDGPQRMNNYQQQPMRMNNYQQQPMRMNNYYQQQPTRMNNYQQQPQRAINYGRQQQQSYSSSNLIDIPYEVVYET